MSSNLTASAITAPAIAVIDGPLLRAHFYLLGAAPLLCSANADVLFDNGPITQWDNRCDQIGPGCGSSSSGFTYFDSFSLQGDSLVTGFTYDGFYVAGSTADYRSTWWAIWSGNPAEMGRFPSPLFSGQAVTIENNEAFQGAYRYTVSGISLELDAGTYWLSIGNVVANGAITTIAIAAGTLPYPAGAGYGDEWGWSTHPAAPNRSFVILGVSAVPEAETGAMAMCGGLMLAWHVRRSRARGRGVAPSC